MNDLETMLHDLFEGKSSVLSRLKIKRGSVITTYLVPQSEAGSLIMIAKEKISFMLQVGICELRVGATAVMSTQNGVSDFSFESSLLKAIN